MKYDICYVTISPLRHERRNNNQMRLVQEMGLRAIMFALWEPGLPEKETIYSTDVVRLKINHFHGGKMKFLEFNWKIYQALRKVETRLLHMHELWVLPGCFSFMRKKGKRIIYDAHEFFTGLDIFKKKRIAQFIWFLVEKFNIRHIDALITVCEPHRRLYIKKYPVLLKKDTLYLLNVPENKPKSWENIKNIDGTPGKFIVYQGLFRPGRGIIPLMKAMQYVNDMPLLMYGYGELEPAVRKLISDLHLEGKVILKGKFDPEHIIHIIRKATAGVVLFEPDSINYRYAMPNKFFEYIQARIPILASNLSTFRAIIKPYEIGIISEDFEPSHIAEKIKEVIKLKNSAKFSEKSAQAAAIFSWDNEKYKLQHLYEQYLKY